MPPVTRPNSTRKKTRRTASTQRQKSYLQRLAEGKGRRVLLDLDGANAAMLDELIASGYGVSQADVLRRALREAYGRNIPRKKDPAI